MEKTKEKILKEASKLFSEFGFSGVSMENIAKKLNITKAALYFHFKSKKEIYLKVLERAFQELMAEIEREISKARSFKDSVFGLISSYLKFGLREKNLIKAIFLKIPKRDKEIENFIAEKRTEIERKFKEILAKKKILEKTNLNFLITSLLGIMDKLILEASFFGKNLDIKKSVFRILRMLKI
jgi:TetR/AcrR family transcriptional regulator